jgi:hypothetical protein
MLRSTRSNPAVATAASFRRINPRNASYCLDFPLPKVDCCNGCRNFASTSYVNIDIDQLSQQSYRDAMDGYLLERSCTHVSKVFHCKKPWTLPPESYIGTMDQKWIERVKSYVSDTHGRINVLTPPLSIPQRTQRMGQTEAPVPPNDGSHTCVSYSPAKRIR